MKCQEYLIRGSASLFFLPASSKHLLSTLSACVIRHQALWARAWINTLSKGTTRLHIRCFSGTCIKFSSCSQTGYSSENDPFPIFRLNFYSTPSPGMEHVTYTSGNQCAPLVALGVTDSVRSISSNQCQCKAMKLPW